MQLGGAIGLSLITKTGARVGGGGVHTVFATQYYVHV